MRKKFSIFALLLAALFLLPASPALAQEKEKVNTVENAEPVLEDEKESGLDVKEIIFHHLGDGYGWEVPFSHVYRIPLPVIVRAEDGKWFCFSSAKLTEVEIVKDLKTGWEKEELVSVIHKVERDGKTYLFSIAPHTSANKNKVVQLFPLTSAQDQEAFEKAEEGAEVHGGVAAVPGYAYVDGAYYREYKTWDISITKNVLALFITTVIVTMMVMGVVRWYARKGFKAPRKGMGFMEMLIDFVYTGVIKSTLGAVKGRKFAPFLLTCFFFILVMNLLGLIVIFPGGANLTGNIAVTLVLAVLTFIVTNVLGKKHYWKEIFWPDVPMFLKCPLPIMQLIEIFGIFTKPAALCVRLFANMMGGHMIVITLTVLIFIFAAFGAAAVGASTVISVLFTIFMLLIDVLVSFIQAYVFTMLSTMFIAMAQEEGHEHEAGEHDAIEA